MRQVLACHDGSGESTEAVEKFLQALGEAARVTVFHVLEPVPPSLLEHEGSEDPEEEKRLARELREHRRDWIRGKLAEANRAFGPILDRLTDAGEQENRVSLKLLPADDEEDFFVFLKEEVASGGYDDVVVAHQSGSWLRGLFERSSAHRVERELEEANVKIVEVSS